MKLLVASALLLAALLAGGRNACALDPASTDALNQTLQALQDASKGDGAVPGVAPGSELDRALEASPELRKELYDLAGQVLREMADEAGGDPGAMSGAVERGRSDPAAFAESLSGPTRDRIRALAEKIQNAGH